MKKLYPYYLFKKSVSKDIFARDIDICVEKLKNASNQEDVLKEAYDIVSKRYRGGRIETFTKIQQLFSYGINDLWNRNGFMHCTNQNYIFANLILRSEKFNNKDIQYIWTNIYIVSPHQYLRIKLINGSYINIDCWARHYGIPYGKYATWFNTTPLRSFVESK